MYPEFIKDAEAESVKRALSSFRFAFEAEKIHEQLYQKALDMLEAQKPLPDVEYYVCPICGFTHEGPFTGKCPICNTSATKFEKIN
jgi:rubrerythrin